jgi:prolyl-tRNA synthetase
MKDAYSFDKDEAGLDNNYRVMYKAYQNIFKRCGLDFLTIEADPGVMGGKVSHEFMVPAENGEDLVLKCPKCKLTKTFEEGKDQGCPKCGVKLEKVNCIEVGHIFKLGTKYSSVLEANFLDADGRLKPIIMGCYGIGVSRLIAAIIEQNHDKEGIIWPKEISPYKVIVLALDVTDRKIMQEARRIYAELQEGGIDTLLDDRDERAGVKFKDADLLGITLQVVVGSESLKNNKVELKIRRNHKKVIKTRAGILKEINEAIT